MSPPPEPIDHAIEQTTGEPFLGPRQAALVDAFIVRFHSGFPLSQFDMAAFISTANILRLNLNPVPPAVPAPAQGEPTA